MIALQIPPIPEGQRPPALLVQVAFGESRRTFLHPVCLLSTAPLRSIFPSRSIFLRPNFRVRTPLNRTAEATLPESIQVNNLIANDGQVRFGPTDSVTSGYFADRTLLPAGSTPLAQRPTPFLPRDADAT